MTDEELLDALHLNTLHLIRPPAAGRELDPAADPNSILPYYFNRVYLFENEDWLTGLTQDGVLKSFPGTEPSKPMMVIVLGTNLTGRSSFINLVILKIEVRNKQKPFLVSVDLPSRDKAACAREMANQFILRVIAERDLNAEKAKELRDIFALEQNNPGPPDAPYTSLFNSLRTQVGSMGGPVVFILHGGDDDAVWTCCLNASRKLADYVIAETGDEDNARSAYDFLKGGGQRVALVVAQELGLAASLEYLEFRLSRTRPGTMPAAALAPFVREAVVSLFEDNQKDSKDRQPIVKRSIGWLSDTLDQALFHFAEEVRRTPASVLRSPPVMTREFMLAFRNRLNKKGRDEDV